MLPAGFGVLASRGKWRSASHLTYLSLVLSKAILRVPGYDRIIILTPPRHGKSSLISHYLPPWWLGRRPDERILLTSYSDRFAKLWGRRARDVFFEYADPVFNLKIGRSQQATDDWGIQGHQGSMSTAGVGGTITGRGADLLIIDDPVKDAVEAESERQREKVWDWWQSTSGSRLEPNACVVVIMTHWHQDDLAGRLIQDMVSGDGEQWKVIRMPAIATEDETWTEDGWSWTRKAGEALWTDRYDIPALSRIQKRVGEKWWSALYQQQPNPKAGNLAKRTWFKIVGAIPSTGLKRCRYWDCAGTDETAGRDPDWTVGALVAWHAATKTAYLEDVIRVRATSGDVDRLIQVTAKLDGPSVAIVEEEEGGSSGKAVTAARKKSLPGFNYKGVRVTGEKASRWTPMLNQIEAQNFVLVEGPWNKAYIDEACTVPAGHDDQMDASSGAYNQLTIGAIGVTPGVW